MTKQILYVDMDGVIADFDCGVKALEPDMLWEEEHVDRVVGLNPRVFETLPEIEGYKEAITELEPMYEIYFLTTPMCNIPESYMGKRIWLKEKFGEWVDRRLILTHRKDLNIGDYLIDDRLKNGVEGFRGEHIHFRTDKFPDWTSVVKYLKHKYDKRATVEDLRRN